MTTHIQVSDTGLEVIPPRDTLTQGSDNTLLCEFEFSGQWLECTEINAVFTDDINSATTPVTGGACVIPIEVLQNPWRFVSVSLNGTGAGGIITSPFVRIGQVLPAAQGGGGGQFVTMAQLMEILEGYVKAEDLGVYATKEELEAARAALASEIAGKADHAAVDAQTAEIETLTRAVGANTTAIAGNITAIATKADKTELADYWSKAEIGLQTSGDGTKYLADDGTYKPVQGGGGNENTFIAEYGVTTAQEILAFIDASNEPFAPMLVKRGTDYYTVVTAAKQDANKVIIRTFATLSGNYYMFTYTVTDGTWASSSYGFQKILESGTNIKTINGQSLLGSGDIPIEGGTQVQADWNQTDDTSPAYIKNKPTIPDVSGLATQASVETVSDAVSALETRVGTNETNIAALQTDISEKASDADLQALAARVGTAETNISTNAGDIATLQTDVAVKADASTVSALATRMDTAETNITALQTDKADASALADYETTAHAAATYETKEDASKIKSVTAAGFAVTPDASGDVNIGGTDVSRTSTSGSWGSEITYTISQTLPAGASSDTKGSTLTVVKRTENSGAAPRVTMMIDSVQLATSADIPDVSHFATTDYVQNTFATKDELTTATNDMATQTWVQQYIAGLDGTNMRF